MTTITAYTTLDMTDTSVWTGDLLSATSSKIVISDGYNKGIYTGSFEYGGGAVTGGTLKGYSQYAGSVIQYKASGGSVSAVLAADLINSNQASQLHKIVLAGNDKINGSASDDNLFGYAGNDVITGGAGNDGMVGGTGNDKMSGGKGDDQYYVDSTGDTAIEKDNEGEDSIFSSVSYTLGNYIEELQLTYGAGNLSGTGNKIANLIVGNDGSNTLNGMEGGDTLYGKGGNDILTGGAGADSFVFDTALSATTNVDTISDFSSEDRLIWLDATIFNAYTAEGVLPSADFVSGSNVTAQDSSDHILYDTSTGKLYYDADGNGSQVAIQFATLTGAPDLVASDLQIYSS